MARPKVKYRYRYSNRQTKLTEECVRKLEEAASVQADVKQRCFYAGISRDTYYRWIKENPDLSDRLDDLYEKLPLKARENIARRISGESTLGDIGLSKWLLERTQKDLTPKLELSGQIDQLGINKEDDQLRLELKERLRSNMHKRWEEREKIKEAQQNENPK
ncbi:hypothetical protein HY967_01480 [Candidatus Jorgensenbacteria bacterium]|nr:hypothetical protein [Candidatus Jorgensenbacteria bacterium]